MENKDYAKETETARAISQFYYSLAWLQTKAIRYVAHGETRDDKLRRVQEMIALIETTGVKVIYDEMCPVSHSEPCEIPPCRRDEMTGMCMCDASMSDTVSLT